MLVRDIVDHQSPAEVAARYGVHRAWVYTLKARYEAEGETALEPRSRRPKTSPAALSTQIIDLIVRIRKELNEGGLDAGPETIAWHLEHHHQHRVSRSTISRHLTAGGLVTPEPKKRPKSSYIRFEASMPNETWQSDRSVAARHESHTAAGSAGQMRDHLGQESGDLCSACVCAAASVTLSRS